MAFPFDNSAYHYYNFQNMKKVYVETYGCQMNEHDSERMLSILSEKGYTPTQHPKEADVVIVNTCSVRAKAEQKAYSSLGRYTGLKKKNPGTWQDRLVVFSGCVAQQEGERLLGRFQGLNVVVGPSQVHRIDELLARARTEEAVVAVAPEQGQDRFRNPVKDVHGIKASVTIMEGCDNFCTYCTVPYLRGREVSRSARSIMDEVQALVASGVREVVLLGQNVNSYADASAGRTMTLYDLLAALNSVSGLERIRFITSHPRDITDRLMHAFTDFGKVCPHLHLPVQSGSDRILKLMARGYTTARYLDTVDKLRALVPGIALTSDFIAGFPSETDEDHRDTIQFIRHVRYDNIFSFKYSDRPLARSSASADKVPPDVIAARLGELQQVQLAITREIYGSLTGTHQQVLVEGDSKKPGRQQGRTREGRIVNFSGTVPSGTLANVLIEDFSDNALYGTHTREEN